MNNLTKTAVALGAAALLTVAAAMPAQADTVIGSRSCSGIRTVGSTSTSGFGNVRHDQYSSSAWQYKIWYVPSGTTAMHYMNVGYRSASWSVQADGWVNAYAVCDD